MCARLCSSALLCTSSYTIINRGASAPHKENDMTKYENECNHPHEAFYGTVRLFNAEGDLYFYVDEWNEWKYCFRYGPGSEYSSLTMSCRPYGYSESMSREEINQSNNNRVKLWGCFAKFLASFSEPSTTTQGKIVGAPQMYKL